MLQCQVVRIFEEAEQQCEAELKALREYRGRDWFRSLLSDYWRVIQMLGASDGGIDPQWPERIARMATVIADAKQLAEQRCAESREQFAKLKGAGFS